eukprot:g1312.t1
MEREAEAASASSFVTQAKLAYEYSLKNFLWKQAAFYAERLVAEKSNDETTYLLGLAYFHNQEPPQWHLQGNKLPEARYLMARCCVQMKSWDQAEEALLSGGTLNEVVNGAAGLFLLGQVQERQGRREQAVECYAKCLQECPFMWEAYERWSYLVLGLPSAPATTLATSTFSDEKFAQSFAGLASAKEGTSSSSRPAATGFAPAERLQRSKTIVSTDARWMFHHVKRPAIAMTVLKDPPLPLPVSVRSKLSFRDTAPSFSCSYCGTESGLMPMEPSILKPQEQTLEGRESYHVLTALTETVRHSQKALNFHCNRLVLLTGDDDLAGHVFRTSQGLGSETLSHSYRTIPEALLDVEVYKRQLESMSDEIVQGRRRWTISRQEVIESGVDFIGSEGTLSNPKGAQAAVANGFEIDPDAPHEFEVKVEDPPDARKTDSADAAQVQPSISDTRRGYSRIRSLLRAGSHVSNLGREVNPGPFSWWVFFRELVKSPKFDLTFAVLIFLSSLVMALQVQYHGFDVGYELGYFGMKVKGFDSLYIMVTSIKASFSALLWSTVLLFAVLTRLGVSAGRGVPLEPRPPKLWLAQYGWLTIFWPEKGELLILTIALILTTLVDVYLNSDSNPLERRLRVFEYYGTFTRCALTLLELTLANWVPASRVLTEDVSEFYTIFVLMFQASMGFSVVKVIMGVIMMNSKDRALQTHKMKMSILFEAADTNGDGRLDREEFAEILADPLVSRWLSAMGFDIVTSSNEIFDLLRETEDLSAEEHRERVLDGWMLSGPASSLNMAQLLYEGDVLRKEVEGISMAVHQELTEIGMEVPPPPLRSESTFHFQLCFAMLICSLCAVMGFEVQYRGYETGYKLGYTGYTKLAHEVWPAADTAFEVVDIFFGVVFTLELILKFIAGSLSFFKAGPACSARRLSPNA